MDKHEFAAIVQILQTAYPGKCMATKDAIDLWFICLKDIDLKALQAATIKYIQQNRFAPTIADIREQAVSVQIGELPDYGEGWQEVIKAISRYGSYNQEEALESLTPITRMCVDRLGWRNLCMSENQAVDRANFRILFEEIAVREMKQLQLSPEVRKAIEQNRSTSLLPGS